MKKAIYIPPISEVVQLQTEQDVNDFNIAVSGTTTPEESDGKGTFFDDEDENDSDMAPIYKKYRYNIWEKEF